MKYFINSTIIYTLANLWLIKVVVMRNQNYVVEGLGHKLFSSKLIKIYFYN